MKPATKGEFMNQQERDLEIARYLKGIVDALRQEDVYATKEDCVIYIEECIKDLGNYTPPETYLQAWYHREFGSGAQEQ